MDIYEKLTIFEITVILVINSYWSIGPFLNISKEKIRLTFMYLINFWDVIVSSNIYCKYHRLLMPSLSLSLACKVTVEVPY